MTGGRQPGERSGRTSTTAGSPRLDSLTGLRAIAALVVFGRHIIPAFGADGGPWFVQMLTRPGTVGVTLFFALSGFVLAWNHRVPAAAKSVFWQRRAARIVPAYLVAFVFAIAVSVLTARALTWMDLFNVTLMQSWVPDADWFFAGNGVGWSLSTEVFFYLVFPYVIGPLHRLSRRLTWLVLGCCVGFAVAIPLILRPSAYETEHHVGFAYWLVYIFPPTRLLEFVAGAALALLLRPGTRVFVKLGPAALIAAAAYTAAGLVPEWACFVAVPLVPFLLLIAAAADADVRGAGSLLRRRPMVLAGTWSYAFYLLHYQIYWLADTYLIYGGQPMAKILIVLGVCFLVSGVAAWLLYTMVEHPAEARLRALGRKPKDGIVAVPSARAPREDSRI
ncbi:acyltransferase [Actinoplanes sp. N902-109]|uniref:acyltransferase family protein n=1 Tax=Actinoplanes sp. (strain N902-109) TaxID=649831 RepID=UPI0003A8A008|nr:acyltransferase [Actinoplanes sp. N902-109]